MSLGEIDSAQIIEAYANAATAIISDNLDRHPGAVGVKPFHQCGQTMVGRALTVRTRQGDNLYIHRALSMIQPGDVVVVDGAGDESRALIGEIMMSIAKSRGAAGMVIDGAIRDVDAIAKSSFPVFARSAIHRGPYKNGPGQVNVPVSIGGMLVNPGDIVVGDCDGVVVFSPSIAMELLSLVQDQEEKERRILASIADGTYSDGYSG